LQTFTSGGRLWIYRGSAQFSRVAMRCGDSVVRLAARWNIAMIARVVIALAFVVVCGAPAVAQDSGTSPATFDGSWSATAPAGAPPASSTPSASGDNAWTPHHGGHGGGHGGFGGGGGGGEGGGHGMGGGGGGHHRGGRAAASVVPGASEAEQNDPGLRRLFADRVTITKLTHPDRMRFDDGTHAVELTLDGMNVSGPAVGGTVALSSIKPDLVVESVTTSGYALTERYALADDGTHLELHASLRNPGASDTRDITRVFDRTPPKTGDVAAKTADATTK
jgi:hypothetical protein